MSGIWNWSAAGRVDEAPIRSAISAVLGRPVRGMAENPVDSAVLCDIYHVGGDFPTTIDLYLMGAVPDGTESEHAAAVAVLLGASLLLPDESLNPTRYVLAEPDGTVRVVHVDETDTDEGTERRNVRPCTGSDPACAVAPERNAA
ncbi:hypothetical protein AB0M20_01305 [Actinoplanes sp. NPDC051633]|uniref:hypothetical protein n=1 Tax=Actinoplanes sp. NPDC051633 TaxID=3155670 RepID=UPI0034336A13